MSIRENRFLEIKECDGKFILTTKRPYPMWIVNTFEDAATAQRELEDIERVVDFLTYDWADLGAYRGLKNTHELNKFQVLPGGKKEN